MLISEMIIMAAKQFNDYDEDGADDDAKYTRVKIADWIDFYNKAQKQLVLVRPDANYKYAQWQLTANETKHTLPSDCVQLISIDRNMGSDGVTPGAPVEMVEKSVLQGFLSTWHSATGETAIELYAYDLRTPKTVWTHPRIHASTAVYVDGSYSYYFTEAASGTIATTDVEADDEFHNALIDWMHKEAYSMDTDSSDFQYVQIKERSFYQALGVEFKSAKLISPTG